MHVGGTVSVGGERRLLCLNTEQRQEGSRTIAALQELDTLVARQLLLRERIWFGCCHWALPSAFRE